MWYPFFAFAMLAPGRQHAFRQAVVAHLLLLSGGAGLLLGGTSPSLLGQLLLVTGIVEGAILIGWRLTQLPKSQALEFLLVSPLRPWNLFLAEAFVGLGRLALVTLSGVPLLLLLVEEGKIDQVDVMALLLMPFTWGAVTGIGLPAWAYEPLRVRRWAERILGMCIIFYLVIGIVVGENLLRWVQWLPEDLGRWFLNSFEAFHRYNPFAVMEYWLKGEFILAKDRFVGLQVCATAAVVLLVARAGSRLKGHFDERHYRPALDPSRGNRGPVGDRPLAWWAVRRVTEYSGRVNLWLAGGFGSAYAIYTVAEPWWPPWLGRLAFVFFDQRLGGIPGLATAIVILAAVPAAFGYGFWDSNTQERCRRLEFLLLTRLGGRDYWEAAAAAAWRRGRGYFAVAVLLWTSAGVAGKIGILELAVALAAAVILWWFYFALGFRAFLRGRHANGLGMLLTLGLPILTYALHQADLPMLAGLLPPGSVYFPAAGALPFYWPFGPTLCGFLALAVGRRTLARCDPELRRWYDLHHGQKVLD